MEVLRRLIAIIAGLAVVAVGALAFTGIAKAAPSQYGFEGLFKAERAAYLNTRDVRCVTGFTLRNLGGSAITMGMTDSYEHRVWFHEQRVCQPIERYTETGRLTNFTVDAFATIGHEAAHYHGTHSEREAECQGVRWAYSYLKRIGVMRTYDAADIRATLLDDSPRPPAYKLHGTCAL